MWRDLLVPLALIASVLVILVPLPTLVIDALLALNITAAIIILLTTIYVRTPLEFSIFPSLLLATTLARLVLNVATTRLILSHAPRDKELAAGEVVKSFSEFVAGDSNILVGVIIFSIIVVIQFVVITKGATRISEVAARFALDGMPGRQMAIDADLNAGIIDEKEAQRRRQEITHQADFFGAMDGASKFVRGDAIAGIVITLINVVAGFVIGMMDGMSLAESAKVFTKLSIGDGLVSQVPAFLISLAAGLLVTRSSSETNLPAEVFHQLFSRPQALIVAGVFLSLLVFTNLPATPLTTIGAGCMALAIMMLRREKEAKVAEETAAKTQAAKPPEERIEDFLVTDPMEIELGAYLIRIANPKQGGDLLDRIAKVRQNVAVDIGIIMPKVRVRDNVRLEREQYRIKIADVAVAEGAVYPHLMLAIDSGATTGKVPGHEVREPAFGSAAVWIEPGRKAHAETLGYTVVEPATVLATHLTEIVRRHAAELLTRDDTKHLIDELKKASPAVVDELIPGQMKLAEVQQILQNLLREQVPIRNLRGILETLGDYAPRTKEPVLLTEYVRHQLARVICSRYRDRENRLYCVTLDPALEDRIRAGIEHTERGLFVRMSPKAVETTCGLISKEVEKLTRASHPPLVLVSPQIRAGLKQLSEAHLPKLVVLSYNEITRDTQIESLGVVMDVGAPK
ncbi:MAG: flagellar biosynthesis protein FlhA [Planctomycetota bacterium]|nr:MAG: flagellar biosynthesis protein FlhA [Planctomycetota bacterium]